MLIIETENGHYKTNPFSKKRSYVKLLQGNYAEKVGENGI